MKKRIVIALLCLTLTCALTACNLAEFELDGIVGELLGNIDLPGENLEVIEPEPPVGGGVSPKTEQAETTPNVGWETETWIEEMWTEDVTYSEIETEGPWVELPMHMYEGERLTLLGIHQHDVGSERSGDSMEEATYARNAALTAYCGIEVDGVLVEQTALYDQVLNDVMAGSSDYDIVFGSIASDGSRLAQNGALVNLSGLPWVDLTHERWDEDIYNGLAYGSYLPMATGSITPDAMLKTSVILFNPELAEQNHIDMYSYVMDGGWTIEKMLGMVENNYVDLNGNGMADADADLFSYVSTFEGAQAFATGADVSIFVKDEAQIPSINEGLDQVVWVYNVLYSMVGNIASVYVTMNDVMQDYDQLQMPEKVFADGRALFYGATLEQAMNMVNTSTQFGMVPYPKATLDAREYRSYVDCNATAVMVPQSVRNQDFSGYALEALGQYNNGLYDGSLSMRICSSPEDVEMLQLILESKTFDFGCNYMALTDSEKVMLFRIALENGNSAIGSMWQKQEKALEKQLKKLCAQMEWAIG